MSPNDIQVGRVYSAKRPATAGVFDTRLNDREVLWLDSLRDTLQYDSPTVGNGRKYPKVKVEAFARWAAADITDQMPADREWRRQS